MPVAVPEQNDREEKRVPDQDQMGRGRQAEALSISYDLEKHRIL